MSAPVPYYQDDAVAIYHGDCREVLPQLPSAAHLLWTDPPYGVSYVGKTIDALEIHNDAAEDLPALLRDAFVACDTRMVAGARFYIAAPAGPRGTDFRLALREVGWTFHQALVWVKHSMVLGYSDYHYQHEDILYGWKPGPGRIGRGNHNGTQWYGDHSQTSVLQIDRPSRSEEHPTMKPERLVATCLLNSTQPGDLILDPFMGSGTTLRAAKNLGRRAIGIEIEERYCESAARRLAQEALVFPEQTALPA